MLGILHKQRTHPTHMPRIPASARQLSKAYEAAEKKGHEAAIALGQAIQGLDPHSQNTEEVQLIIRRATTRNELTQVRLAAADFPVPIAKYMENCEAPITNQQPAPPSRSQPPQRHQQG